MAIQSTASSTQVTFPDQQAITEYLDKHPSKMARDTVFFCREFPDSTSKVARYFAGKQMQVDEIPTHVKKVLLGLGNEDMLKLSELTDALQALSASDKESNNSNESILRFNREIKEIANVANKSNSLVVGVAIFTDALKHLLEGATFTPPIEGKTEWIKHVPI